MRTAIMCMLALATAAGAGTSLQVGDGRVDGTKLRPYDLTWRQCSLESGRWVARSDLNERLIAIGSNLLRVQQLSRHPDGASAVSTVYFDRRSLAPLRMEHRVVAEDGTEQGSTEHSLDERGYRGRMSQGDRSKLVEGKLTSKMLHGGAMGLPLATLDFQAEPVEFPASMINFDASYKVTATWVGRETMEFNGMEVRAWLVDTDWVHEGVGDVYPGGPDKSGGRYWLVYDPPEGFPYVPRYKTDTYAVEFVAGICPENQGL